MKRTGSQTVIDALKAEKVEVLFGFPGGVVIPVFDALYGERSIRRNSRGCSRSTMLTVEPGLSRLP